MYALHISLSVIFQKRIWTLTGLYLKTYFVTRSKHTPPRLEKPWFNAVEGNNICSEIHKNE
jgi:hypothetical protein